MTPPGDDDGSGVTGALRRAVGAAYDATVGRVGEAALEITDNTARQVIEELEPYLIAEAIPRILEGLTPYLEQNLVPEIVDALVPHINEAVAPEIIESVTPMIINEVAPKVIEAMLPQIIDEVAPKIIEGLMPEIIDEVAPAIIEGLMPMIVDEVAPAIIDGVMPKIQNEVVPAVMDEIVDDPRVRQLIREQSAGLVLDALERVRRALARADDAVENVVRWATGRGPRPTPGPGQLAAPVGRSYPYAGFVSRGVALVLDLSLVGFLVGTGIAVITRLINNWVDPLPTWLNVSLAIIGLCVAPIYLGLCWVWFGQTIGDGIFGVRLNRVAGGRMTLVPALLKGFVGVFMLPLWVLGMITSAFNERRQGLLDIIFRTDSTYLSRELWVPPPDEPSPPAITSADPPAGASDITSADPPAGASAITSAGTFAVPAAGAPVGTPPGEPTGHQTSITH